MSVKLYQIETYLPKPVKIINQEFKVGELYTDQFGVEYLKLYLHPTNGNTYDDGSRGTRSKPFNSLKSALDTIKLLNIEKKIIIDGQGETYELTNSSDQVFHSFKYLKLTNMTLTVSNMTDIYALCFFNNDTLELDTINMNLNFSITNHNEKESLIYIDSCSQVSLSGLSFNNSDPTHYINNGMLITKSKVVLAGNIQGLSVDNTPTNSCCVNVVRFDTGDIIYTDDGFSGNLGYAREFGFVYRNCPIIKINSLDGEFGKSLYTSL